MESGDGGAAREPPLPVQQLVGFDLRDERRRGAPAVVFAQRLAKKEEEEGSSAAAGAVVGADSADESDGERGGAPMIILTVAYGYGETAQYEHFAILEDALPGWFPGWELDATLIGFWLALRADVDPPVSALVTHLEAMENVLTAQIPEWSANGFVTTVGGSGMSRRVAFTPHPRVLERVLDAVSTRACQLEIRKYIDIDPDALSGWAEDAPPVTLPLELQPPRFEPAAEGGGINGSDGAAAS